MTALKIPKIGDVYGDWTIVKVLDGINTMHVKPNCLVRCVCGNEEVKNFRSLFRGKTLRCKSCKSILAKTHGETKTRLYSIWQNMKRRCYNKNNPRYKDYGGRGIRVCKKWRNCFESFRDWALQNGYEHGLSINRKDNNKNYTPLNCDWQTTAKQALNTRRNKFFEFQGKLLTMKEIAALAKVDYGLLRHRLMRGWTVIDALKIPAVCNTSETQIEEVKKLHSDGLSQKEIANKLGLKVGRVWYALNKK